MPNKIQKDEFFLPDTTRSVLWRAATDVTQFSFCIDKKSAAFKHEVAVDTGNPLADVSLRISSGSTLSSDSDSECILAAELAASMWPKCAFASVNSGFFFSVPHSATDLKEMNKQHYTDSCNKFAKKGKVHLSVIHYQNKKLSYRRGTARCVASVEILPIATQQCSTTSPEQIEVMKL